MTAITELLRRLGQGDDDALPPLNELLGRDPRQVERVCLALGDRAAAVRSGALRWLCALPEDAIARLAPYRRRLMRHASLTDDSSQKRALSRVLPRLPLERWDRNRLAILLETWSTETGESHWQDALSALTELAVADATVAPRFRRFLTEHAQLGDPRLAERARSILEQVYL